MNNTDMILKITLQDEKLERLTDELLTVYRLNDALRAENTALRGGKAEVTLTSQQSVSTVLKALWEAAPEKARRRSSKKQVLDAWKATKEKPDQEDMLHALEAWMRCEDWTKSNGDFVQGLHLWIKNRQWENVPDVEQDAATTSETHQIIEKVNDLKTEWQNPATWSTTEIRILASSITQMKEASIDWKTLKRFLNTHHSNAKAYWIPQSRGKLVETFSDVYAGCQRWADKQGIKTQTQPTSELFI
tara:strand:+ start:4806 stop:5543 length:738 start_codon:yes stop_codon:yes gene_type:complete